MDCSTYNCWRRDIAAEYVIRTGRAFPKMSLPIGKEFQRRLVVMSDQDCPPEPSVVVDILMCEGLLK